MKSSHSPLVALICIAAIAPTISLCARQSASQQAPPNSASTPDPLAPLLAQAQDALDRKDYAAAIATLQNIVAKRAADAVAHFELGYAYSETKQFDQAAAEYRRAVALNDQLAPAHLNLGLVLRESDPAAAAAEFQRAAALMPGDAKPHQLAADALERNGKPAEAIAEYRSAATLAPKDAATRMALGNALLRANRAAEAEPEFREAAALGGGTPAALGLARALAKQDKNAEAIDAFGSYLKDNPGDAQARFERAVALQNASRLDESVAELDRIEQAAPPSPEALKLRASIYIQQKKWMEAGAVLDRAIGASSNDTQLYAWLGTVRLNLRDFPAAVTALRRSLDLDPAPIGPLRDLVDAYYFSQQWQPALAALDLLAKRTTPTALDWFLRATCYDKLRQVQDAADAYQKFLDVDNNAHPDQEFGAQQRRKTLLRELKQR